MRRRIFFVCAACAVVALIIICNCVNSASENSDNGLKVGEGNSNTISALSTDIMDSREIVCWGDSMTSGSGSSPAFIDEGDHIYNASYKGYPEILQHFTGITTYNFGVPGATSADIVLMQSDNSNTGDYEYYDPDDYNVYDPDVVEESIGHMGDVLILEIGSNGGWDNDYTTLIEQYREMIDYAGCSDYIIIGDTDDPGLSADENQEAIDPGDGPGETAWETALRNEFGDHFINMRVFLIENGLTVSGLEEHFEDIMRASEGCISKQLRADWTHLNSYGYYAEAVEVYQRGIELGYWS